MIKRFAIILLLLWIGKPAWAQSLNKNEQVSIDLNTGFSIVNNSFTDTWDAYPAVHLNLRIPFYAGQLETGVRYTRFEGMAPTTTDSDFSSFFIHFGWGYPLNITSRYEIAPTIRFGNNIMLFDKPAVFVNHAGTERFVSDPNENEFAYELALRNQFSLSKNWRINATLSYNRTLTFFPLQVTLISVGLTYSFPQAAWLKHFIE